MQLCVEEKDGLRGSGARLLTCPAHWKVMQQGELSVNRVAHKILTETDAIEGIWSFAISPITNPNIAHAECE